MTAQHYGQLLAEGLSDYAERYDLPDEGSLTDHLSRDGQANAALSRSLARAFHLYWRGEYEASAHLIYPKIEAAARMLLLELDEALYRTQVGADQGGYGGLYGLLSALEQLGMDEDWCFFLKWLLLGPAGVNLRNDLSHGLVLDPGPVYAVLTLRAAALLIGLTAPAPTDRRPGVDPNDLGPLTVRQRDDVLGLLRRPLADPRPWPVRDCLVGRAVWLAALAARTAATILNDLAVRLHP